MNTPASRTLSRASLACLFAWCLAILIAAFMQPARAHGDEDHSHDDSSAAPATLPEQAQNQMASGPRGTAQTEAFEIVAVLATPDAGTDNKKPPAAPILTLYLDDFATNAPVLNAKVEVESGTFKAEARMQTPGVYVAPAAALAKPGNYPLTVSVETQDTADLLDVTLNTHAAYTDESAYDDHGDGGHKYPWRWGIGIAAALIAAGLIAARTRAKARATAPSGGASS